MQIEDLSYGEGDELGDKLQFQRTESTITSGNDELTFTVTIGKLGESETVSATVTITGASGNGYTFSREETI